MKLTITIKNQLDEILAAQTSLTEYLLKEQCEQEKIDEVCLIAEEILVNIISHGFEDQAESEIKIELSRDEDEYCLKFHDRGISFNPLEADERPEGKVGGWGIPLVIALAKSVEYSSDSGTNVLKVQILKRDNQD